MCHNNLLDEYMWVHKQCFQNEVSIDFLIKQQGAERELTSLRIGAGR